VLQSKPVLHVDSEDVRCDFDSEAEKNRYVMKLQKKISNCCGGGGRSFHGWKNGVLSALLRNDSQTLYDMYTVFAGQPESKSRDDIINWTNKDLYDTKDEWWPSFTSEKFTLIDRDDASDVFASIGEYLQELIQSNVGKYVN